jgi:small subunit ribosomal protein S8
MAFNDPIAEFLTMLRNAKDAEHRFLDAYLSNEKLSIIKILKDRGFIDNYLVDNVKKKIRVFLKYTPKRESIIQGLKRISKPGSRRYVCKKKIPHVLDGIGIAILSTSKGIVDDETARNMNVGGELLCLVW